MKSNKVLWFLSFIISLVSIGLSVFIFLNFINNQQTAEKTDKNQDKEDNQSIEQDYYQPQDNVGAVTFTEDQITEIARNMFSYDDFLKDVSIDFEENKIIITAKIKDSKKLIKAYPELEKYSVVIKQLEDKTISVNAIIKNIDGKAEIGINSVVVDGVEIDGEIISPFIEEDDFSKLFEVDFENIQLTKDTVVFKNGVPDILKY